MAKVCRRRNKWIADFRDPKTQKRHWVSCATRKEAEAALTQALAKINAGTFQGKRDAVRFEELAETFLKSIAPTIRPSTFSDYKQCIERHLLPAFKGWRLADISVRDVEQLRSDLRAKDAHVTKRKLSPRTCNKVLTLAGALFEEAERHGWMSKNPARLVRKLRKLRPEGQEEVVMAVLNPPEIQALLDACEPKWRPIIMTGVFTGLRVGELLGLAWSDVDWNSNKIHVRRSYTFKGFQEPKTKAGRRTVDMPATLVRELKAWKLACPKAERKEGEEPGLELCFANGLGHPESPQNVLHRGLFPALRRAGLRRIRFHDLRHTFASLMLANNEPITAVQHALGHASPAVTLGVYSHMLPGGDDSAARRLDVLIGFTGGSKVVAKGPEHSAPVLQPTEKVGRSWRIRTADQRIKSPLLYQLS